MTQKRITPPTRPFSAAISPPGSKSLTNRALILASLSTGPCTLSNLLFAEDTRIMLAALESLGFILAINEPAHTVLVEGQSGQIPRPSADLFCGNSGTSIRFLTALCSLGTGTYTLDGIPRMRQRPIAELASSLKQLGVRTAFPMTDGFPPIQILAQGLPGGLMSYGSAQSSQFLSAILQVAPYAQHEVRISLDGPQTSWPYVAMTMQLMDHFGVTPELIRDPDTGNPREIIIPQSSYSPTSYHIEPDASNATYFLAAAALHPGSSVTIPGLGKHSLQGDVSFATVLQKMGATVSMTNDSITLTAPDHLDGIDIDLSAMPDTAQTLAVTSLFAKGPTRITGLRTLRVKETDRLTAVSTELQKLGASVTIQNDDTLLITPPATPHPAAIDTYDDHRMAMSFALASTRIPGVLINHPECTAKTYPHFFTDLETLLQSS
jgi:3-phosphoshikimate 1-carboxyvinyltransferase